MAVSKTGGAYWERTDVINGNAQTWLGWFRPDVFPANGDYRVVLAQDAGANNWMGIYVETIGGATLVDFWSNNLSVPIIDGPEVELDQWVFVAVVRSGTGTSWKLAWRLEGESSLTTATGTGSGTIGTVMKIGAEHTGNAPLTGGFEFWRVFPAALSDAQILTESASETAAQAEWADWPIDNTTNDETDISGNNRPLTLQGLTGGAHANTTGPDITIPGGGTDGTAEPAAIAVAAAVPQAVLAGGASRAPAAVAAAASLPVAALAAGATASPAAVAAPAALPALTLAAGATVAGAVIEAPALLPAASPAASEAAAPGTVAVAVTAPQAAATVGGAAVPAAVAAATAVPAPAGSASVGPAAVETPAALPFAAASGGGSATVAPDPVAAAVIVLAAATSAGVGPSALLAATTIPSAAATGTAAATANPAAVTLTALLPQAAVTGGGPPAPDIPLAGTYEEPAHRAFRERVARAWREP